MLIWFVQTLAPKELWINFTSDSWTWSWRIYTNIHREYQNQNLLALHIARRRVDIKNLINSKSTRSFIVISASGYRRALSLRRISEQILATCRDVLFTSLYETVRCDASGCPLLPMRRSVVCYSYGMFYKAICSYHWCASMLLTLLGCTCIVSLYQDISSLCMVYPSHSVRKYTTGFCRYKIWHATKFGLSWCSGALAFQLWDW